MTSSNESSPSVSFSLWPAILVGGLAAGVLDGASAFLNFGWRMPYGIASGLLGAKANPAAGAGPGVWLLGLACHCLIALVAAAFYCQSSRRWGFLRKHFLFGGVVCGVAVWLVMNTVVLPLSAVPFPVGPFSVAALRTGLAYLVVLVGLPISFSLWFFARRAARKS